jgi:hypothetical protein
MYVPIHQTLRHYIPKKLTEATVTYVMGAKLGSRSDVGKLLDAI